MDEDKDDFVKKKNEQIPHLKRKATKKQEPKRKEETKTHNKALQKNSITILKLSFS